MSRSPEVEAAMQHSRTENTTHDEGCTYQYIGHLQVLASEVERLETRVRELEAERDLWYTRCASVIFRMPGSVTAGQVQQWEADYRTDLAKEREKNARLRKALGAFIKWSNPRKKDWVTLMEPTREQVDFVRQVMREHEALADGGEAAPRSAIVDAMQDIRDQEASK